MSVTIHVGRTTSPRYFATTKRLQLINILRLYAIIYTKDITWSSENSLINETIVTVDVPKKGYARNIYNTQKVKEKPTTTISVLSPGP